MSRSKTNKTMEVDSDDEKPTPSKERKEDKKVDRVPESPKASAPAKKEPFKCLWIAKKSYGVLDPFALRLAKIEDIKMNVGPDGKWFKNIGLFYKGKDHIMIGSPWILATFAVQERAFKVGGLAKKTLTLEMNGPEKCPKDGEGYEAPNPVEDFDDQFQRMDSSLLSQLEGQKFFGEAGRSAMSNLYSPLVKTQAGFYNKLTVKFAEQYGQTYTQVWTYDNKQARVDQIKSNSFVRVHIVINGFWVRYAAAGYIEGYGPTAYIQSVQLAPSGFEPEKKFETFTESPF